MAQKRENNARIRFLSEAEEEVLRQIIKRRCPEREAEFDVGIYTGMRRSEQYGLLWLSVNFVTEIITIPCSKHGKARHMPINSGTRKSLEALLPHRRSDNSPVCPGGMGRKGYLNRWFFECAGHAGMLDVNWHTLRHTYISRLVMRGVDIRTVQELAGHRTIQMTMRYAHLAPGHLREACEKAVWEQKRTEIAMPKSAFQIVNPSDQTGTKTDTSSFGSRSQDNTYLN